MDNTGDILRVLKRCGHTINVVPEGSTYVISPAINPSELSRFLDRIAYDIVLPAPTLVSLDVLIKDAIMPGIEY